MLSVFVTESVVRAVILKTTFVHCTTTLTHQQILHMRSTDWLSHHRLAIYRYEKLGTNVSPEKASTTAFSLLKALHT